MPPASLVYLPTLQAHRLRAALTQAELADLAGCKRITVARIEGGRPTLVTTARALAHALKLKPADLIVLSDEYQRGDRKPEQ